MNSVAIYCADVGSVQRNNFGWARQCNTKTVPDLGSRQSIQHLVDAVAADLKRGVRVALGFECPLFVPFPEEPERLTAGRLGEGDRAWSAGAGASCLATGLTETLWVLDGIRAKLVHVPPVYLDWPRFAEMAPGLFLWEAFVTKEAKLKSHQEDAEVAVRYFQSLMPAVDQHDAIKSGRVRSLIGAAVLQSGWSTDLDLLQQSCLVLKPH